MATTGEKLNKQPKDYELFIKDTNTPEMIQIGFNIAGKFKSLGWINNTGENHFLSKDYHRKAWEIWKENGFKVAQQEPFDWRGFLKKDSDNRIHLF
jgi:hypothetical protein